MVGRSLRYEPTGKIMFRETIQQRINIWRFRYTEKASQVAGEIDRKSVV